MVGTETPVGDGHGEEPLDGDRSGRPTRRVVLVLVAEVLTALVLGSVLLGHKSFWLDEAFTWSTVDRPFPDLVHVLVTHEGFQSLHTLLLWPVNRLSSTPEALRFPSVLAFAASIPAVWLAGRRLFDDRAGLGAGLLLAVNGLALQFAQEARSYALAMMLTALAAAFLAGEVGTPTLRGRQLWIAASALAVYAHGYAILAVGSQVLSLAVLPAGPRRRRLLSGAAVVGVLVVPAVLASILQSASADDMSWIDPPTVETVRSMVWLVAGRTVTAVPVYAFGIVATLLAGLSVLRGLGRSEETWRFAMPFAWLVLPIAVPLAASFVSPVWHYRYAVPSLGALVLIGGYGLTRARRQIVLASVLVVASLLAVRGVVNWYGYERQAGSDSWDDFDDIVAYMDEHVEVGDGIVVVTDWARFPFEFYARGTDIVVDATPVFPEDPWGGYRTGEQTRNGDLPDDAQMEKLVLDGPDRLWVVAGYHDRGELRARLNQLSVAYDVTAHLWFPGLEEVRLLDRL